MAFKKEDKKDEKKDLSTKERVDSITAKMEKDFGKGIIMGAKDKPMAQQAISTGSIGLNKALGIGGLPKGRIVEIFGPESSGKTTMCLELIVQAHKESGKRCAIIDTEHSIDLGYAEKLGVDMNRLDISQPDYGEQALEIAERLIESKEYSIVVVDSVAALVPKSELEGDMGDPSMGKHARLMSQALRKLAGVVNKSGAILMFTNQMRDKIGVMFGSPETTTGGNALKFYASIRMDVRRSLTKENSVLSGETKIGNKTTVKVIKNKVAPPFREAIFNILYGEGIDTAGELLDLAVEADVVSKNGTFFSYSGNNIGQGRDNAKSFLKANQDIAGEIERKVVENFVPKEIPDEEKAVVDEES
jgi:recombination protein RecA